MICKRGDLLGGIPSRLQIDLVFPSKAPYIGRTDQTTGIDCGQTLHKPNHESGAEQFEIHPAISIRLEDIRTTRLLHLI